ncbi:MAG: uroporphyrinogen decarboxylase/cobalamine-independent methonine synthase family protein [Planctomycetota bacterium]
MAVSICQQISYIAPPAPAMRQPACGNEPFIRPEIGFTPKWFRTALGIDFGKKWHTDPAYRRETIRAMRPELRRRFPGSKIGGIDRPDKPLDLLTGLYGGNVVAIIYGVPALYAEDNWPNCEHKYFSDDEVDSIEPPNLDENPVFQDIMRQVDWVEQSEGGIHGFLNWQGILNNAQRLRGEKIFFDLMDNPERCQRLFECIYKTMSGAIKWLHERQSKSGVDINFMTVSNCLVNMISPQQYSDFFLP